MISRKSMLAAGAMLIAGPAWAQSAPPGSTGSGATSPTPTQSPQPGDATTGSTAAASATGFANGDIVVTARRKAENIQSTPVSVTAFNADTLREAGIAKTSDLMIKTPGVFLGGSGGRENSVFQIRGQSKALSGSNAPAVVSYFADVPQPTFSSGLSTYDMASVQVLKGPQGTLFGRNTTGGAVLFYPTAPTYDLNGYLQGTYGRFNDRALEGAVTVPIVNDHVSLRVAGLYEKRDGYTRNVEGGRLDNINTRGIRGSLLIQPIEAIKNLTIVDYYRSSYNSDSVALVSIDQNPSLLDLLGLRQSAIDYLALENSRSKRLTDSDVSPAINVSKRFGVTNRTDVDLGSDISFTNIFGYRRTYARYNINTDGAPLLVTTGNPSIGLPPGLPLTLLNAGAINHVEQYTDEVQLRGKLFDSRVDWLVGGFYLHSDPYGSTGTGNSIGQPVIPGIIPAKNFATFNYNFYTENSRAVFGNIGVKMDELLEGLRFNAGVRYTWDRERACTATDNTTQGTVEPAGCVASNAVLINPTTNRAKSSAPTWTIGFDWQVSPRFFTYIVTRRGYRTGGINTPTFGGLLAPLQSFGPEKVTDVELGIRSDLALGGVKLRFNASGFAGYYSGVQIPLSGVRTNPGCIAGDPVFGKPPYSPDGDCNPNNDPQSGTLLANAGKSRVAGVDLDGRVQFTDHFVVTYGANFLSTKTRQFAAPAILQPYIVGNRIPFNLVAKRTATFGAEYTLPLEELGEVVVHGDIYFSSRLAFTDTYLPSYHVANFRIDWNNIAKKPVDLGFYITNAFDNRYQQYGSVSGLTLGFNSAILAPPRQFGAQLRYHF